MANNDRVDTIQILSGFPPLVKNVPPVWPTQPTPDKISLLWKYNTTDIYHRFSPYTEYDSFFGVLSNKQPFVWRYPDEKDKSLFGDLPKKFKAFESRAFPLRATTDDLVRIGKWSISSPGAIFYAKQFALQLMQPFDETRLYNPLSPILSTINPLAFGIIDRPTRHVELSLAGLINAVGGSSIARAFGINLDTTPSSTVGAGALPNENKAGGKGLLRGHDAGLAYSGLQTKWPVTTAIGKKSFLATMGNAAQALFLSSITGPGGPKSIYRADEGTYDLMINSNRLGLADNYRSSPAQMWYAFEDRNTSTKVASIQNAAKQSLGTAFSIPSGGPAGVARSILGGTIGSKLDPTKGMSPPRFKHKIAMLNNPMTIPVSSDSGFFGSAIGGKPTGYTIIKGKEKYGQNVYPNPDDSYENSDMLVQYSEYIGDENLFPSKFTDPTNNQVVKINSSLQKAIQNINLGAGDAVGIDVDTYSRLMSSGRVNSKTFLGYGWYKDHVKPKQVFGAQFEYANQARSKIKSLDISVRNGNGSLRMATSFKSDALNRISILEKDRKITPSEQMDQYPGYTEWEPYKDDLIAFFFYDVVNEKYIPFRATVKGIAENNSAPWDELAFIGRADKLYNYTGFTRTLNFTFNVVVNSIMELLPVWRKINYMASAVKPANYTTAGSAGQKSFNRFMIPPMFMLTIGDLYRYQPVVITSVNVNIPEDAAWETLNQDNSNSWGYLNNMIFAGSKLGKNYGQLPREAEIQITCNVLEKERAIIGAGHYGHAPHTDLFLEDQFNISEASDGKPALPYLPTPTDFHKNLLVYNGSETVKSWGERVKIDKAKDNAALIAAQLDEKSVYFIGPKIPPTGLPTTTGNDLATKSQQSIPAATNKLNSLLRSPKPGAIPGQSQFPGISFRGGI